MVMIYIRYWKLRKKIIPMLFQKWLRMKNVIIAENFSYAILLLPLFNTLFHALLLISSKIMKLINMVMLLNRKRILMQTEMKSILLKNFRMILLINLLDRVKIWQLISFICMIFNFIGKHSYQIGSVSKCYLRLLWNQNNLNWTRQAKN